MKILILLGIFLCTTTNVLSFLHQYPKLSEHPLPNGADPGEPLFITPYLKAGKILDAQNAAKVIHPQMNKTESYSGYFTVDAKTNSNMFFWYFPAKNAPENAPVVLWLQGGPGATSLYGLFTENGPFEIHGFSKIKVKLRKYTWTEKHHVIYIDNPVGTGFSFADKAGYSRDEKGVGWNLYNALLQFFIMFPKLKNNEFYVTGESYAGKYVPAVAYTIHKNNPNNPDLRINLAGVAIGNGLSDPEHQLHHGEYLYQLGLIDSNTLQTFLKYQKQAVTYIQNKQFNEAFRIFDDMLNGDLNNHTSIFKNATGFTNYFNYLQANSDPVNDNKMGEFLQRADVRKAIHVGNLSFHVEDQTVEQMLMADMMNTVAPWVSELISNYRVLTYNGQLDIIVAYPLTENYLKNLPFSSAQEYKVAPRHIWRVDNEIAGFVKTAGNLTEIMVRNAGHMVPADQPKWAMDLINRFTSNKPFY